MVTPRNRKPIAVGIVATLIGSAVALAMAPAMMPSSYSWISHTTSESAAQGVDGAWLARLGFLGFGLSVVTLSLSRPVHWDRWARGFHFSFGSLMAMAAAVSIRSWNSGAAFDSGEDWLHSFAATAMGFAFAFGVTAVAISLYRARGRVRILDIIALIASVAIPLGMLASSNQAGLLQRSMFLVAFLWYGREALMLRSDQNPVVATEP